MDEQCDVAGCSNPKVRTIGRKSVEKIFTLKSNGTKAHLCREHYKQYKKATKKDREIDRLNWV
ncbi:MAG: hypothetical protein QXU18_11520 [Thermoplasmatales archaeon]